MSKRFAKVLFTIVAVLLTLPVLAARNVSADYTECTTSGTVCFFVDVSPANNNSWENEEDDIPEGTRAAFHLFIYNWTSTTYTDFTLSASLPSGLEFYDYNFTVTGYDGAYDPEDLFNGGINIGELIPGQQVEFAFLTQPTGSLNAGINYFTVTGNASATGGFTASNDATANFISNSGVKINEINWGGSSVSAADEWIELYNNSGSSIDLSGYTIEGAGSPISLSGTIAAGDYFLVSRYNSSNSNSNLSVTPDQVAASMSIANTAQEIALKNNGSVIDTAGDGVNTFAGYHTYVNRSMARIDTEKDGADINNWFTSENAVGFDGGLDKGTPGSNNFTNLYLFDAEDHVTNSSKGSIGVNAAGLRYAQTDAGASGQYIMRNFTLPAGSYWVNFITASSTTSGTASLAKLGVQNGVEYSRTVNPANFATAGNTGFQNNYFQFKSNGSAVQPFVNAVGSSNQLLVDKIIITPVSSDHIQEYEAEDLYTPYSANLTRNANGVSVSSTSIEDYFYFGPYSVTQDNGTWYNVEYLVSVDYSGSLPDSTIVGYLDVGDKSFGLVEQRPLTLSDFAGKNVTETFEIHFKKSSNAFLEFRARSAGNGVTLSVDKVRVYSTTGPAGSVYEAEDYRDQPGGTMVYDTDASNNLAIMSTLSDNRFIRRRVYNEQVDTQFYKVTFRAKVGSNTGTDRIARIGIFNLDGKGSQSSRYLIANEFDAANTYQDFDLYFRRSGSGSMEFYAYSMGNPELYIDSITVVPSTDDMEYHLSSQYNQVGSWVYDGSSDEHQAFMATDGSTVAGYLAYGPWMNDMLNGNYYNASFELKVSDNGSNEEVGFIDIYDASADKLLGKQIIRGTDFSAANTWETFSLNFQAPAAGNKLEFRTYYSANGEDLYSGKITIAEGTAPTSWVYQAEDARHQSNTGSVVTDGSTVAYYSDPSSNDSGYSVYGPYTTEQPAGDYRVDFYLKVDDNSSSSNVARIDAYNSGGSGTYAFDLIAGTDFTNTTDYQVFSVNFTRVNEGTMEYRVLFNDVAGISIDRIEVVAI